MTIPSKSDGAPRVVRKPKNCNSKQTSGLSIADWSTYALRLLQLRRHPNHVKSHSQRSRLSPTCLWSCFCRAAAAADQSCMHMALQFTILPALSRTFHHDLRCVRRVASLDAYKQHGERTILGTRTICTDSICLASCCCECSIATR